MGNKGSTAIAVTYLKKFKLLFLNCHLAAGHKKCNQRNKDFHRINYDLTIPGYKNPEGMESISDLFDVTIWMGDFNYRINSDEATIENLLLRKKVDSLLKLDQFFQEIYAGRLDFNNFFETRINFLPTYKFVCQTNEYDFQDGKLPGWTDRVIFKSKDYKKFSMIKYNWISSIKFSDHKPVVAEFIFNVEDNLTFKEEANINIKSKACVIF